MKQILFVLTLISFIMGNSSLISFAILPMESTNIPQEKVEEATNSLYKVLLASGKYRIVDRQRIAKIMMEQEFQLTGSVDDNSVVELGKLLGADKLFTSKIYKKNSNQYAINFHVIDVATAQIEFSLEESSKNYTPADHGRWVAADIINKYPLTGKVLGKAGDIIVVNLGKSQGVSTGDRLFVAREELLRGDDGEILFKEQKRVGQLTVTKLDAGRAQTTVKSLHTKGFSIKKGDIVSPEPIPAMESKVWSSPQLGYIKKGKLLLEDDMREKQYLTVNNNSGNGYSGGILDINATHKNSGHAHCFYPAPFDKMENVIVEGEVEFQDISKTYNKFTIVMRYNGKYMNTNAYSFFFNDEGGYEITYFREGKNYTIQKIQATPAIKRNSSMNRFKIVAYGPKFDFYINDQFVVSFENELYEKGHLGFFVNSNGHSQLDNVSIWEAVK